MNYSLRDARSSDNAWLEALRRAAYEELFYSTWGSWDEGRHRRHFTASWERGGIQLIKIDNSPVGMIQVHQFDDYIDLGEIQILLAHQRCGVGTAILIDLRRHAAAQGKDVVLSTCLMNEGAFRLYKRLGFEEVERTHTHIHMRGRTGYA